MKKGIEPITVSVFHVDNIKVTHEGGWFNDVVLYQGDDRICLDVSEAPALVEAINKVLEQYNLLNK